MGLWGRLPICQNNGQFVLASPGVSPGMRRETP